MGGEADPPGEEEEALGWKADEGEEEMGPELSLVAILSAVPPLDETEDGRGEGAGE